MAAEPVTTQQAQDQGALAGFTWDNGDTNSFFGMGDNEPEDKDEVDDVVKEVMSDEDDEELEEVFKQKTPQDTKPKAPTKKEVAEKKAKQEPENTTDVEESEEDADDFFEQPSDKKKGSSTKEAAQNKDNQTKSLFSDLALDLKDRGTFQHVEIKDGEEIDEDRLHELIDNEVEARTDETFEAFFEELPEDGKEFLKFAKAGGSFSQFMQVYSKPTLDIQEFDSDEESHRKKVITHYLMTMDDELTIKEAEEQFEVLEESGKSKKLSERYFNKIQQADAEERRELLAAQQEAAENRDKAAKAFAKTLGDTLQGTDEFKGFSFSVEEKKKLNSAILKPTINTGKGKYIPQFNHKLGEILKAQTPEARQRLLLLAKLVESDFDMTGFSTKVVTKKAQEVQSRLRAQQQGVRPSSSGIGNNGKKSLADFID